MLDREFGPLMGNPSSIRDEDITAKSPSEMDNSLEALNLTLHIRLARLMAQIITRELNPLKYETSFFGPVWLTKGGR